MKNKLISKGSILLSIFVVWTFLIITVDVKTLGVNGTEIGFSSINTWFHQLTGVHMAIYTVTDWLSLVPVSVCSLFAGLGLGQLIKRKSLTKVDTDILLLGAYYGFVMVCFMCFELIPINYRPILLEGVMEASYPSSTTLLVLGVMPTMIFQAKRRLNNAPLKRMVCSVSYVFCIFMVLGRLFSGVHWLTDIIGGILLSTGLFYLYKGTVEITDNKTIN